MRVLVAGDRGNVGAVIGPFLQRAGHHVVGLDAGSSDGCDSELARRVATDAGGLLLRLCDAGSMGDANGLRDAGDRAANRFVTAELSAEVDAYVHAGGQFEWDFAAPVAVAGAAGLHATRLDGDRLAYNRPDPYLPDLLVCRQELAAALLAACRPATRSVT